MLGLDLLHQILAGDLHHGGLHISKMLKCNKALLILKKCWKFNIFRFQDLLYHLEVFLYQ